MSVVCLTSIQLMEAIRVSTPRIAQSVWRPKHRVSEVVLGCIQFSNQILEWYVKSSLDLKYIAPSSKEKQTFTYTHIHAAINTSKHHQLRNHLGTTLWSSSTFGSSGGIVE
jgi:hypothetical protein